MGTEEPRKKIAGVIWPVIEAPCNLVAVCGRCGGISDSKFSLIIAVCDQQDQEVFGRHRGGAEPTNAGVDDIVVTRVSKV